MEIIKEIIYLGQVKPPYRYYRLVLCDFDDIQPRKLPIKDMSWSEVEAVLDSKKVNLENSGVQFGLGVDTFPPQYRNQRFGHVKRQAKYMVVSKIYIEGQNVGFGVIDNRGRFRLWQRTLVESLGERLYRGDWLYHLKDNQYLYIDSLLKVPIIEKPVGVLRTGNIFFEDKITNYRVDK